MIKNNLLIKNQHTALIAESHFGSFVKQIREGCLAFPFAFTRYIMLSLIQSFKKLFFCDDVHAVHVQKRFNVEILFLFVFCFSYFPGKQ